MIVGPAIGDDALVATPLADRYRIPTINWAGTERARSEYMFHLQVGSHEDESIVIARHLLAGGIRRVGVVFDRSPIGRRYLSFLLAEADVLGIKVAATSAVSPLAEDAEAEAAPVLEGGIDGLIYLGLGLAAPAVARAATAHGWDGPRAMNTAGMRGYSPEFGEAIEGWTYVDMHSDANATLAELRRRMNLTVDSGAGPAYGFDVGRLVAEALARAPERTRDGLKDGLEQGEVVARGRGLRGDHARLRPLRPGCPPRTVSGPAPVAGRELDRAVERDQPVWTDAARGTTTPSPPQGVTCPVATRNRSGRSSVTRQVAASRPMPTSMAQLSPISTSSPSVKYWRRSS